MSDTLTHRDGAPHLEEIKFPVKSITWLSYEQATPILQQEKNGPCPLIALVNTLLLKSDIVARTTGMDADAPKSSSPADVTALRQLLERNSGKEVPLKLLLLCLGDYLVQLPSLDSDTLNKLLESLPLLHTGLSTNPDLTSGYFAKNDLSVKIFDAFGLIFVHGWAVNPERDQISGTVFHAHPTFDALQDYLLTAEDSDEKQAVTSWLDSNASQLTSHGLKIMDQHVEPDLVAVFFRNNHFSTLYKANDHDFYLLITDSSFSYSKDYVWQSLISVSGKDDLFFKGDFTPISDEASVMDGHEDLELARRLQEEEDESMAQRLQSNYDSRRKIERSKGKKGKPESQESDARDDPATTVVPVKKSKNKGRSNCTII